MPGAPSHRSRAAVGGERQLWGRPLQLSGPKANGRYRRDLAVRRGIREGRQSTPNSANLGACLVGPVRASRTVPAVAAERSLWVSESGPLPLMIGPRSLLRQALSLAAE